MDSSMIMLAGLPGTGKSTLAGKLEERLGYDTHSFLGVRRDLGHERYMPGRNGEVFQELYLRTTRSLDARRGVIFDSTNTGYKGRERMYLFALDWDVDLVVVECLCSEKESRRRMRQRPKNDGLFVEPRTAEAYRRLTRIWEEIGEEIVEIQDVGLSHVRYNSENNSFEEVRVVESARQLVDVIRDVATSTSSNL